MCITPLHLDEHLLVVDKPEGLLSVPGRGEAGRDNLASRVQSQWPDALVVHRLDQATSGLVVFGRGAAAQRALSMAFAERRVAKRYTAVVAGSPAGNEGRIELPLVCDWPNRPRQMVDFTRGKPSLTHWRVLAHEGSRTRLALQPVTGRSHQLRVHLMAIGHAIVGDTLYAGEPAPRLLLHAEHLAFEHPTGGAPLAFTCPAPF